MAKMGDLDIAQRAKRWGVGLLMVAVGAAIGVALPNHTASPNAAVGTVTSVNNPTGGSPIQFTFKPKGATSTTNYTLENPTPWQQQANGSWHTTGQPSCLVLGSTTPVPVTLGVVAISGVGSAPGGSLVAWVECYG